MQLGKGWWHGGLRLVRFIASTTTVLSGAPLLCSITVLSAKAFRSRAAQNPMSKACWMQGAHRGNPRASIPNPKAWNLDPGGRGVWSA